MKDKCNFIILSADESASRYSLKPAITHLEIDMRKGRDIGLKTHLSQYQSEQSWNFILSHSHFLKTLFPLTADALQVKKKKRREKLLKTMNTANLGKKEHTD